MVGTYGIQITTTETNLHETIHLCMIGLRSDLDTDAPGLATCRALARLFCATRLVRFFSK